ncbi:MAG: sulfite exporter TauE/SafE family protein [Actinomycetota bacterium]|nr:sulfite exporter TauE/SafE family protein [Actinomycetota bacterium]
MAGSEAALLVVAGFAAGLAGSIAGLASLISYPALLAAGLPPLTANVTNTAALIFSSVGSVAGSRVELVGQGRRMRRLGALGVIGGMAGSALLLATPAGAFELVVPWLVGLASVGILIQRSPERLARRHHGGDGRALPVATLAIGVYGGYFGAGAGVFLLAVLLLETSETFARSNAAKNVVLGAANAVAAIGFAFFGPVRWAAAIPLAIGFLVGGRLGPPLVRRAPSGPLRVLIAAAGIGLAVHLGLDAYG